MMVRLNKQLIREIASLRNAEIETNTRTLARKEAVTDNAREVTAAATASDVVGASDISTTPTGITASSGQHSVEAMD